MMKNIMWIQSENIGGSDYYFADGVLLNEGNASVLSKAVNKLLRVQEMRECLSKRNVELRKEQGYANFTLAYGLFEGFLFKSVFNETTKSGRRRGFAYWCLYSDVDNLWSVIETCASNFGYTIRKDDIPVVEKYVEIVKKRRKAMFSVVIIFLILILTLFLCKI